MTTVATKKPVETAAPPAEAKQPSAVSADWRALRNKTLAYARGEVRDELTRILQPTKRPSKSRVRERRLAPRVAERLAHAEQRIGALFAAADVEGVARRRERSIRRRELGAAVEQVREGLERMEAISHDAQEFIAARYMRDHGRGALGALAPLLRFAATPVHDVEPMAPADLVLRQLWLQLNGGRRRCRVCDAPNVQADTGCGVCGAPSVYATQRGTSGSSFGHLWWTGKAKPRDLALMLLLGGTLTDGDWKIWARRGERPAQILVTVAHRVAVRLAEFRTMARARAREVYQAT